MRTGVFAFSAWLFSLLICASPLLAQGVEVNAVSFAAFPRGENITVETYDDSETVLKLKKQFEEELRSQGYTVTEGARLILSFETQDTSGKWSGGGPNRLVQIGNSENHTGKDAPDVRLNIFDSQRGGILNPKRDKGITQIAPSQFRIDATVEDRQTGKRLWQGWSVTDMIAGSEETMLHRSLVKPIVDNIGKTVRSE
ncbi:hypothetical protein L2D14_07655 [Thalassospiraceae bacterium LMO-JJ14]|nr:hypothetical protein L2D14_07655 [Thalassospiraceae bacterium LMO-JJ14]